MSFLKPSHLGRRGGLLLFTFLGLISSSRTIGAALVTVNTGGPITTFWGVAEEKFGTDELGSLLRLSFTYDADWTPGQSLPSSDRYYPPLEGNNATTSASLGNFAYDGPASLHLEIGRARTLRIGTEFTYGDWMSFSVNTPDFYAFGQMMFPVGMLNQGALIPDSDPAWAYTTLFRGPINGGPGLLGYGEWQGEIGPGIEPLPISPVPEPATYGAWASLLLVGVAALRRRKAAGWGLWRESSGYFPPMHISRISIVSIATLSLSLSALATSIPIPNGSFEDPVFSDGSGLVSVSSGPAFGWFFDKGGPNAQFGIVNPNDDRFAGTTSDLVPLPSPAEGNQYAIIGTAEAGQVSSIRSGVLGVVDSATVYTASVAAGNELTTQFSSHTGRLSLSLLSGGDVIATNFVDYSTVALGTFQSLSVQFNSLQFNQQYVGTSLGLEISYLSDIFGDNSVFDNVILEAQSRSPSVPDNMGTLLPSLAGIFAIALFYQSRSKRETAKETI